MPMSRRIGGRETSAIGLGGALWSVAPDEERDDDRAIRTIHEALDRGIRLIDTASVYTTLDHPTHNESLIGRSLAERGRPDDVLIVTKGGHYRAGPAEFPQDARPETLRRQCEASLGALGVERIDLYLLHRIDPAVPLEESIGAMAELRDAGKVAELGVSTVTLEELRRAQSVAPIAAVQNAFSPYDASDLPLVESCAAEEIAYLIYSPLGGPGRIRQLTTAFPDAHELAEELGVTLPRLVLAWELAQRSNVIPVVGATRPESAADAARAMELELSLAELARLDAAFGLPRRRERPPYTDPAGSVPSGTVR